MAYPARSKQRQRVRWRSSDDEDEADAPITGAGSGIVCGGRDARHREGLLELMATILRSTSLARISTDTEWRVIGGRDWEQTPGIPRGAGEERSFRRNVGVTADFEVADVYTRYTAPRVLEIRL